MALRQAAPLLGPLAGDALLLAQPHHGRVLGPLGLLIRLPISSSSSAVLSSATEGDDGRKEQPSVEEVQLRQALRLASLGSLRLGPMHSRGASSVALLPLLLQARGLHTSAGLHLAAPGAGPSSKAGSSPSKASGDAAEKPTTPLPNAEDADQAISTYEDLSTRLAKLSRPSSVRTWDQVVRDLLMGVANGLVATVRFLVSVPGRIKRFREMPKDVWAKKKKDMWAMVKHEAHHYWVGTKLLALETRIASGLALKAARGHQLTRRERRQLTRTTADLFRLVPFLIIMIVPFLELLLPVLLKIFPNLLPSTYEDKLKKEEEMKRGLMVKIELARFLQDTVAEMAQTLMTKHQAKGDNATAQSLYDFINRVRSGEAVENHEILRFAQLFSDDITLDSLERLQLVSMCQFVGISPFGTDQYLRSKLRQHLQKIKQDDYEIENEGLENLSEDELRSACRARGMRAPFGEGAVPFMRKQMQDWLDLSLHRGLPSSLLLMSRAFTITASVKDVAAKKDLQYISLRETLGAIPSEAVKGVEFEALGAGAGKGAEALTKKLAYLKREEELIKEEAAVARQEKEAAEAKAAAAAAPAAAAPAAAAAAEGGAAAAAPSGAAAGAGPAAGVAGTDMVSAGVAAAAQAVVAQAIKVESLSVEEKAAKAAAEREARVAAIISALIALASKSGVAQERAMFLQLVGHEIDRVNANLANNSESRAFAFGREGLEVAEGHAAGAPAAPEAAAEAIPASRLNARVSKMLKNIEKELDKVEHRIGDRMHVLDVDSDGVISRNEVEKAISFLKTQLSPEDMDLFYSKLGQAAQLSPGDSISVADLLAVAKKPSDASAAPPPAAAAAEAKEAQEVVKIHTR